MAIPIIGQPQVEDWFISLQVRCPCGAQFMLVGQPGSMRACEGTDGRGADCGRVYAINSLPVLQTNGVQGETPIVFQPDGTYACGLAMAIPPKG